MIKLREQGDGFIPDWIPPKGLPSTRGCKYIAIDTETMDDSIRQGLGSGGCKGMGRILGISIATDRGYSGYFDTRVYPMAQLAEWARKELCRSNQTKVYANGLYDIEWFHHHGIPFDIKNVLDVQIMEPLIDSEKRLFNLESLAEKYLPPEYRKCKGHLEALISEYLGKKVTKNTMWDYLDQVPPECIGGYAEMDAIVTLKVAMEQLPLIAADGLERVMDLERRQWPILLQTRINGIRIDTKRLEETHAGLVKRVEESQKKLNKMAGFEVEVTKTASKKALFEKMGVPMVFTAKGNPSFKAEVIEAIDHPVTNMIRTVTKDNTTMNFTKAIFEHMHKGRIHAELNQLKSDETGTVSGRYSASHPNIQNQPGKKNPEMGAMLRSLYLPEKGCDWASNDYTQIEFRLIADYAARTGLKKADVALQSYIENPLTDFHMFVMGLTGLPRPHAKTINFGLAYRMGMAKLIHDLGVSDEEGRAIFKTYHGEVPFVQELMQRITMRADKVGYVCTLSGRRSRFDLWEDGNYGKFKTPALPREEALVAYGKIKRAFTFKAGNRVIQGSAADIMKEGMASAHESGVYEVLYPHCFVHDEANQSMPRTKAGKEAFRELTHVMTSVYKDVLKVPITMESTTGPNWWEQKEFK